MNVNSYKNNILLKTDSYKLTHWKQLPPGTTKISSYMESRLGSEFPSTVFFGLQPYLRMLEGRVITREKIMQADAFSLAHFGAPYFNKNGWLSLLNKYDGFLPIKIRAVKEGTNVPIGNALMVIENTDPEFPWLSNFLETLLMKVWYTTTVATNSFYCRSLIKKYLEITSDNPDHILFALHDFGYRGVSSEETAALGGMAHLINFMGTDTLAAIIAANEFYNERMEFKMYAYSVSASEHSTATPWGKGPGELNYIDNMLKQYPTGVVSMVADSYDTFEFARKLGSHFKDTIENRDGRVVVRPDSGDPVEVNLKLIQILAEEFGTTINSKGYKVLPTCIRIIQGDGIDYQMIERILIALTNIGFSAENIVFGSGGGLLQRFDRDTQRFAIKCSYALINGAEVNVQKDPATSNGSKKSKAGQLKLTLDSDGKYHTVSSMGMSAIEFEAIIDELVPVFANGLVIQHYDFDDIRAITKFQL